MRYIMLSLFLVTSLTAGKINIAVAANVSYAIEDLKKEFYKQHPDTKVNVTLGGSGKLTAQIKHGAPYQIFMSADMAYPEALVAKGMAITNPIVYAQGTLAMLSAKKQNLRQGLALLRDADIDKIAIANPKTAPYGRATVEALKNAGLYDDIKKKFVYGESISQTVSYTVTATDMGFIAKSALFSPKMSHFKKDINWVEVDAILYTPINQGIVMLKEGKNNPEVKAFYTFIQSDKAKEIFRDFGYIVP